MAYTAYLDEAFSLEGGSEAGGGEGIFSFFPVETIVSFGVAIVAFWVNFFARMLQQKVVLGEKQQALESSLRDLAE